LKANGGRLPREKEDDYAARVNILYARSKDPSTTSDIDRATRSRTGGLATQTALDANLGTAARLHFEEQTGAKEKQPTSITEHKDGGPVHGTLYKLKWSNVGYGKPTYKWVTKDKAAKWPELMENYNKVILGT
jgi:hypothetical protein